MLTPVAIGLALTAFLAGVTGSWSPCGFSMVDSLSRGTREGKPGVTLAACATFGVGAIAGGASLFGLLAAIGAALGAQGSSAGALAAFVVAAVATVAELRGVRIRPQIRRQVPEAWRRTMPLPLAGALYGVLLGLGFTTFVLTLTVAALAAISLAFGDALLGIVVGACFGAGRMFPVLLLAPATETAWGMRAVELMGERPLLLRGFRALDGAALGATATAIAAGPAWGSQRVVSSASDPSAGGGELVFENESEQGVLRRGGNDSTLPGTDPALGGPYVAWRNGETITIAARDTLRPLRSMRVAGVNAIGLSSRWLAWRRETRGGERIEAMPLRGRAVTRRVRSARAPTQLSAPSVSGDRLAYSVSGRRGGRVGILDLGSGRRRTVVASRAKQLVGPSLAGRSLAYVSISRCGQRLQLRRRGHDRVLLRGRPLAPTNAGFDRGHTRQGSGYGACPRRRRWTRSMLWTTALGGRYVYVTIMRPGPRRAEARIVRVRR